MTIDRPVYNCQLARFYVFTFQKGFNLTVLINSLQYEGAKQYDRIVLGGRWQPLTMRFNVIVGTQRLVRCGHSSASLTHSTATQTYNNHH